MVSYNSKLLLTNKGKFMKKKKQPTNKPKKQWVTCENQVTLWPVHRSGKPVLSTDGKTGHLIQHEGITKLVSRTRTRRSESLMLPRCADLLRDVAFWRMQSTSGLLAYEEPAGIEETRSFIFTHHQTFQWECYTVEFYSCAKKNEIFKQMDGTESNILNEVAWTQKDKWHKFPLICGSKL